MLKLLSLFSGIGAFEKALENIGEPYELINYCFKNFEFFQTISIFRFFLTARSQDLGSSIFQKLP